MDKRRVTRRSFIKGATAAAAAAATAAGAVGAAQSRLAMAKSTSPNDKLNVAAIGCGGMGFVDAMNLRTENVVALCDVDGRSAERAFSEFPKANRYKDFREMLEKEDLDAVTVSTPDHSHAVAAMAAMSLGLHVYVQKPLTHTVAEARMLGEAAKKYGVKTQMGNQGHCSDGIRKMCEMIWNGDIGQVREVHFVLTDHPQWAANHGRPKETPFIPQELDWYLWLSVAPDRPYHPAYAPRGWRDWHDFGSGSIGDMGCHVMDAANWALGLYKTGPTSVEALVNEGMTDENYPRSERIRWEFPARGDLAPVTAYWHDGGLGLPEIEGFPSASEFVDDLDAAALDSGITLFVGDKGAATMEGFGANPKLVPDEKMRDYSFPEETIPRIPDRQPVTDWIDSIKNDTEPCSSFGISAPFTEWVNLGNLRLFHKGKLKGDAQRLRVTNNRNANDGLTREYRDGWDPAQFA